MGIRKCAVSGCLSTTVRPEDIGVTFHSIPQKPELRDKWCAACKIDPNSPTLKNMNVCSRHFLASDFKIYSGDKYLLIRGIAPTIFAWDVDQQEPLLVPKTEVPIKTEPGVSSDGQVGENKLLKAKREAMSVKRSASLENRDQRKPQKKILRKSSDSAFIKKEASPVKKFDPVSVFTPGTAIEARDFNNIWHKAKVMEVDINEGEVLIHFEDETNEKSLIDEWIPMDSSRLRPLPAVVVKPAPLALDQKPPAKVYIPQTFQLSERCFAKWSDSRKFKATVQKVLPNNMYEVLFDDGYIKTVPARHISRMTSKGTSQKIRKKYPPLPAIEYVGEEWYCQWVDDAPVGQETLLDGPDSKKRAIIVEDVRLPKNFVKYFIERTNVASKWDVVVHHPSGKRFRSRQEVRIYMEETNEEYNLANFDFAIHKKKAKEMGVYTYTEEYRKYLKSLYPTQSEIDTMPKATIQPQIPLLPYILPGEVVNQNWIMMDGFKIQIIDNLLRCPKEGCFKNFRKENLLKIHIKHYHEDLASKITEPPTMTDLAYQRTASQTIEDVVLKSPEQSPSVKPTKRVLEKMQKITESKVKTETKTEKSSILEDALTKSDSIKTENTSSNAFYSNAVSAIPAKKSKSSKSKYKTLKRKYTKRFLNHPVPNRVSQVETAALEYNEGGQQMPKKIKLEPEGSAEEEPAVPLVEEVKPQPKYINENGEIIKIVRMKQEEVINCLCGICEEDGLMIQCELCLCWQHGYCNNIQKESEVPEKYVCYICRYPDRGRTSMKYIHDQDWLFEGKLPTGDYHAANPKLQKRFDVLKKSHTLTGNLLELKRFLHSLKVKMNIADNKDHPKLYLWSKRWESNVLADQDDKLASPQKAFHSEPNVPQPEAAIDSRECQRRLLEHLKQMQNLAMTRLDSIENQIQAIEANEPAIQKMEPGDNYPKLKTTLRMMIQDLNSAQDMALTSSK